MDPGVPIALRMSGHLLLGVVRIYSKKVEYLHQDCKDALTGLHKAFATLQFAQPEEARPAPFQSVTLPGTFDLDAQNIDDQIEYIRYLYWLGCTSYHPIFIISRVLSPKFFFP